ncbi:unnamed protein product [Periconia digitata]|uniref:Uncharacterized protein n=1 Tax=Periconia digitata TaxID=1303443 RepID=A0A9W4UQE8_9PLEO|nr:unnamed protein product [Periconia digitata]
MILHGSRESSCKYLIRVLPLKIDLVSSFSIPRLILINANHHLLYPYPQRTSPKQDYSIQNASRWSLLLLARMRERSLR